MHSMLDFDVSADGQRLLVPIVTSQEKSKIVVIQNWEAAAQKTRGKPIETLPYAVGPAFCRRARFSGL